MGPWTYVTAKYPILQSDMLNYMLKPNHSDFPLYTNVTWVATPIA